MAGTSDRMVKDIRGMLKGMATKGGKYFKGTARMFLASGGEMFNNDAPIFGAMLETNKDILQDTVKFLRSPVDSINKGINKALQTEDFKALQQFAHNAVDDLLSGNIYDPDRMRSDFGSTVDSLLDNFGDFDMSGFDESGEYKEPDVDTSEFERNLKLAEAQEQASDTRTEATISAVGSATAAIVHTENANAQTNIRLQLKQHSQMMSAMQNMITQQAAGVQAVNMTATSILDISRESHQQVMESMKTITDLLTDIRAAVTPKQEEERQRDDDSPIGANGELNIRKWLINSIKKADSKYNISGAVSMAMGGMDIKNLIQYTYGDNPLMMFSDLILGQIIPKNFREQLQRTNTNLKNFIPGMLGKLNDRGKKFEESGSLKDLFAGLFGLETRSRSVIDPGMKNASAQAVITNRFVNTVEQVIPMWLSQIHTDLTGARLQVYNTTTGKLEDASQIYADTIHSAADLVGRMGTAGSDFMNRAEAFKFGIAEKDKEFQDVAYRFLQRMAESEKFINPYMNDRDFNEYSGLSGQNAMLIKAILQSMDPGQLMALTSEMQEARRMRDRANTDIHKKLREDGTMAAAMSGWIPANIQSKLDEAKYRRSGLSQSDIDKIFDESGGKSRPAGISSTFGGISNTLNDIYSALQRGIITYTYIMGDNRATNGELNDDVMNQFKSASNAAKNEQQRVNAIMRRRQDGKDREEAYRRSDQNRRTNEIAEVQLNQDDAMARLFVDGNTQFEQMVRFQRGVDIKNNPTKGPADNPGNYRQQEQMRKLVAGMASDINNTLDKTGFKGFVGNMKDLANTPFTLMQNGLRLVDSFLFRIMYGEDASQVILDDNKLPSILDAVRLNVKAQWMEAGTWFQKNIGDPVRKSLLDEKDGLIPKIGNRLNEVLISPVKDKLTGVKNDLIGTKNGEDGTLITTDGRTLIKNSSGRWIDSKTKKFVSQDVIDSATPGGMYSGGKYSDKINSLTGKMRGMKGNAVGTVKNGAKGFWNKFLYGSLGEDSFDGSINGDYTQTHKGLKKTVKKKWIQDEDYPDNPMVGKWIDEIEYEHEGFMGGVRHAFNKLQDILFGPDENGDDHGSREKFNLVKDELKKAVPDMTIGAGLGVIGSLFLPGGPILGALLGSAGGFVASSERFKEFIFGEEIAEDTQQRYNIKTGKMEEVKVKSRKGALISKEVYDGFKKFAPKIAIGAGLGIVGSMFLPGGPFIGALMGSIGGMTAASDKMKKLIFGDAEKGDDDGLLSKNIRKHINENMLPILGGAGIGAAGWSLISSMGIIPGLSLLPGGPIFAMMGALTAGVNADRINNFFFGEEKEVVDEETGKTEKKRVGGLFGRAFDYARDHIISPFAEKVDNAGKSINKWFDEQVVGPFSRSIQPLKDKLREAGENIGKSIGNIGNHIKESIDRVFENSMGIPLKEFFQEKIMKPMNNFVNKIFSTIGKVIGSIISAPFKALELIVTGGIDGKNPAEIKENRQAERDAKRKQRRDERKARQNQRREFLDKLLGKANKDLDKVDNETPENQAGSTPKKKGFFWTLIDEVNDDRRKRQAIRNAPKEGDKNFVGPPKPPKVSEAEARASTDEPTDKKGTDDLRNQLKENDSKRKADKAEQDKKAQERTEERQKLKADETERSAASKRKGKKSDNDYLKMIEHHSRGIYEEVRGQLGSVGWNIAYIKVLLEKKFGMKVSEDEYGDEMDGKTKKGTKKHRGILGKAFDRVTAIGEGIMSHVSNVISGAVDFVTMPFRLLGKAAGMLKDGIATIGSSLWNIVKVFGAALGDVVRGFGEGIGQILSGIGGAVKNFLPYLGKMLGDGLSLLTGVIKDAALSVTSVIRGVVTTLSDIVPDIIGGIWDGLKFVGKGAVKGVVGATKLAGRGIAGAAGWIGDHLPGRNKEGKEKIKKKYLGTVKVDGGFIDEIKGDTPVSVLGGKIPYPALKVARGRAIGATGAQWAIPVYILGADRNAKLRVLLGEDPDSDQDTDNENDVADNSADNEAADSAAQKSKEKAEKKGIFAAMQARFRNFKRKYFSVDRKAESSSNPAESYDDAVRSAQSMDDIEAIMAANQMNANSQVVTGSTEEKKSSGILDLLGGIFGSLLGGEGLKGVATNLLKKVGLKTLGTGALELGSMAATGYNLFGEKGNKLFGAESLALGANKVISTAIKGSADDVAKLGPVKSAIAKVIKALFNNATVQKMFKGLKNKISPLVSKLTKFISDKVLKKAMESGAGKAIQSGLKQIAAFGTGGILAIGFAVVDFVAGFGNAKKYFNVFGSDVTLGMRLTSAVVNTLGGLLTLIPYVGSLLSVALAVFQDQIVQLVYGVLADDAAMQELKADQEKLQTATDEYNAANGTNLTVDEYAKKFNEDGSERKGILGTIGSGIAAVGKGAWNGLKAVGGGIGKGLSTVGGWFVGGAKKVGDFLGAGAKKIGDVVGGGVKAVASVIADPGKFFGETLPTMIGQGAGHVYNFFSGLFGGVKDLFGKVKDKLVSIRDNIGKFFTDLPGKVMNWATNTWNKITTTFGNIKDNVVGFVTSIPTRVMTWAGNTWSSIVTAATGIKDAIVDFVVSIPGRIAGFFEDAWESATEAIGDAVDAVGDAVGGAVDTVTSLPGKALDFVGGAWDNAVSGFKSVTGLGPGDNSNDQTALEKLLNVGRGIGQSLIDMMTSVFKGKKNAPGIFNLIGQGMGSSLIDDMHETDGKNTTIGTTMATAVGTTVAATNSAASTEKLPWYKKAANAVKGWLGWGSGDGYDGWGTGVKPMSQSSAQWNHGSKSMAKAGCGPTAAAMVASAYGAKSSPDEANRMSYGMGMRASDGGTNPKFFSQYASAHGYGMAEGPVSSKSIASNLNKGRPVVVMGKGGSFGGNMHYMVAERTNGRGGVGIVDPTTGARKSTTMSKLLNNTKTAIYSYGKGPGGLIDEWGTRYVMQAGVGGGTSTSTTDTQSSREAVETAQQALVDKMASVKGQLRYSLNGGEQNPDKGVASCASTVGWAYDKVLGVSGMSAGSSTQSRDSRFTTIWTKNTANASVPLDKLQPGDIVYTNWDRGNLPYDPNMQYPMAHTEMYVGNGQNLSHGGPGKGPIYVSIPNNDYGRLTKIMAVRRYTPFVTGDIDLSQVNTTQSLTGVSSSTTTDGTTTSSSDSSNGIFAGAGLFSAISSLFEGATSKLTNLLAVLTGGSPTENASGDESSTTDTSYSGTTSTDMSTSTTSGTTGTTSGSTGAIAGMAKGITSGVMSGINMGMLSSLSSMIGGDNGSKIWNYLAGKGLTPPQIAGIMGNLYKESGLQPNNLQNSYEKSLGYTDESYTKAVNDGTYKNFANDSAGYGLAQWTYHTRKANLLEMAKASGRSIDDLSLHMDYLWQELNSGSFKSSVLDPIKKTSTVREAAKIFMQKFEKPAGYNEQWKIDERANAAQAMYDQYGSGEGLDTFDPSKIPTDPDQSYGTGPSSNNTALMNQVRSLNKMIEKTRADAKSEATVAEVTNKITDAIVGTSSSGANADNDALMKMISAISTSLGVMVEHLAAIRENTEKTSQGSDDSASDINKKYSQLPTATPIYPEGDDKGRDTGVETIDRLTRV